MTRRFHNLSNAEGIAFQDPAQEQAMLRELESQLMDVDMQNCSQDFAPARPVLRFAHLLRSGRPAHGIHSATS